MNEKKIKVFKIIALVVSIVVVLSLIYASIEKIKLILYLKTGLNFGDYSYNLRYLNQNVVFVTTYILSIALIATFNFFLWFKDIFEFVEPEKIAERKALRAAKKKQKLEDRLRKLD